MRLSTALEPRSVYREMKYNFKQMCNIFHDRAEGRDRCLIELPHGEEIRMRLKDGVLEIFHGSEEYEVPVGDNPEFDCSYEYKKDVFMDPRGGFLVEWNSARCVHEDDNGRLNITYSTKYECSVHSKVYEPKSRTDFRISYYNKREGKKDFEISISAPVYAPV